MIIFLYFVGYTKRRINLKSHGLKSIKLYFLQEATIQTVTAVALHLPVLMGKLSMKPFSNAMHSDLM